MEKTLWGRRGLLLVLVLALAFSFVACAADKTDEPMQTGTSYAIDREMDKQLSVASSNVETGEIIAASCNAWRDLMDEYYDALLASERTDIAQGVVQSQTDWQAYYQTAFTNEEQLTEAIYGGGSTRGLALARFEYASYRNRALELYTLCCQALLSEAVTAP